LGAAILRRSETMPQDVQIDQPAGCEQPVGILLQAAIPHFGEPEFQLDHTDHMLRGSWTMTLPGSRVRSETTALRSHQSDYAATRRGKYFAGIRSSSGSNAHLKRCC
jgi:hypothetical protein